MGGLKEKDLLYIINTIKNHPEIEKAVLFGSRAMGNFKRGSDVDIALIGESISFTTISEIKYDLEEESPMPYFFDILNYHQLKNEELKKHIDTVGKCFYDKSSTNNRE